MAGYIYTHDRNKVVAFLDFFSLSSIYFIALIFLYDYDNIMLPLIIFMFIEYECIYENKPSHNIIDRCAMNEKRYKIEGVEIELGILVSRGPQLMACETY